MIGFDSFILKTDPIDMSETCKKIKERLMSLYNKFFVIRFKVVVLGLEDSGKSAVVPCIFENGLKYMGKQKDAQVYEYNEGNAVYIIYDVSGKRASRTKWDYFYRKCDVLLYCVDSSGNSRNWRKSREELKSMLYRNVWMKKNLLVLGTKNDKESSKACKDIILDLDLLNINDREISCFSVSASQKTNTEYIKPWIVDQCKFLKERSGFKIFRS